MQPSRIRHLASVLGVLGSMVGSGCSEGFSARPGGDREAGADAARLPGEDAGFDSAPPGRQDAGLDAAMGGRVDAVGDARDDAPRPLLELGVEIVDDADDATWIGGVDERLHFSPDELSDEIGVDADLGRMGLRFRLPVPRGARIESAVLGLLHLRGDSTADDTIRVQVFDSATVPPFSDAHVHTPAAHDPGGIWPALVGGFAVGRDGARIESPDLGLLIQHVVDRTDWTERGIIGFVLSPDRMQGWSGFADSASGAGAATLRVTYREQ